MSVAPTIFFCPETRRTIAAKTSVVGKMKYPQPKSASSPL